VVLKMLTKGIVPYLRGVGPLFALVLAVMSAAPVKSEASTYHPSNHARQNAGPTVNRFLSFSTSGYGWESVDRVSAVDDANKPVGVQSLIYVPDDGQERPDEFSNVARHGGLRKFLLLVFICGAVIRFFTSQTFLSFITDALDPKSW
jgi:hypothetical protein